MSGQPGFRGTTRSKWDRLHIKGGKPLSGTIPISGAKNAALPLMTAALLTDGEVHLENVPRLTDVRTLIRLLTELGCEAELGNGSEKSFGKSLRLKAETITSTTAPYELVSQMRASFWVLGPLLGRFGEAPRVPARRVRHRRPPSRHIYKGP